MEPDIVSRALEALRRYSLCDHCLGRLFARLGYGLENDERGRSLKNVIFLHLHGRASQEDTLSDIVKLAESGHEPSLRYLRDVHGINVEVKKCYICGGELFNNVDYLVKNIVDKIHEEGIEFKTYHVGTRVPKDVLMRELEVATNVGSEWAESIKRELNRLIGKKLKDLLPDKIFERLNPDVEIIVDICTGKIDIEVKPLYVYTRYRKIIRGVSQVQLRLNVITSLQKTINDNICSRLGAREAIVHASGREDTDVRMLGRGRPLVISFINPRRRPSENELRDVIRLEDEPFELSITDVKIVNRRMIEKLKGEATRHVKIYRALVLLSQDVTDEQIRSLEEYFHNRQIVQYTPRRIKRKSPKKRRVRMVYELKVIKLCSRLLELIVKCQGGLYVKELITGDEGRTSPSISDALGQDVRPLLLDVLDVLD
ncbi:MAG: tRNA pseudouridine(54/55) synthase Pus10 [Crenarchaeota archaeon]|nr:tRNA pseudouridine(54/55) synthase Pus10 [Thermoproteota archaeon]